MPIIGVGSYIVIQVEDILDSVGFVQQDVPELNLSVGDAVFFNTGADVVSLKEDGSTYVFIRAGDIFGTFTT
jgi:co-chaperonin GroES (HSP10)